MLEVAVRNVLQNRCSLKFRNIHRKTPVLESLFNKVAGLNSFFIEHLRWLLLLWLECSV